MANNEAIISKLKISKVLSLILFGIGMLLFCYYLISASLDHEYPQIIGLIAGAILGFFGVISLVLLLNLDKLELETDKLKVISPFKSPKKTIYISEIKSFNEIEKNSATGKEKCLTIFTDRFRYKISSSTYTNYEQLKATLTKDKFRNTHSEEVWEYKMKNYSGWAQIVFGLMIIAGIIYSDNFNEKEINSNKLTTINGTISNELKISKRKSKRWIDLKVEEYPGFTFKLNGDNFHASNSKSFVAKVKKGDKIELDILIDAYQKKLIKSKELSFWEKGVNYELIQIFGLRDHHKTYLKLTDINNELKSSSHFYSFILFLSIGIAITVSGVKFIIKNFKPEPINTSVR